MTYLRYSHSSRPRDNDPFDDDTYYARPLVRRNSKRQRAEYIDNYDNGYDDYPYSSSSRPTKSSRSQLEKYNIWTPPSKQDARYHYTEDSEDERRQPSTRRYKYSTSKHYSTDRRPRYSDEDDYYYDDEVEREFRLKVKAELSRRSSAKASSSSRPFGEKKVHFMPEDVLRKEKWDRDYYADDYDDRYESSYRFSRMKRSRTDEWKPLSGFSRY